MPELELLPAADRYGHAGNSTPCHGTDTPSERNHVRTTATSDEFTG
jgi:hypothetical protein